MHNFPNPAELLPHSGFMKKISRILSLEGNKIECLAVVSRKSAPFFEGAKACASAGIEYMAQASGCLGRLLHKAEKRGVIVAVRKLKSYTAFFNEGDELLVSSENISSSLGLHNFKASLKRHSDGELLMEANITIFEIEDDGEK